METINFYSNNSKGCKTVEASLKRCGINFQKHLEEDSIEILPIIQSQAGLFNGQRIIITSLLNGIFGGNPSEELFSQGLKFERQGNYTKAKESYIQAINLDKGIIYRGLVQIHGERFRTENEKIGIHFEEVLKNTYFKNQKTIP